MRLTALLGLLCLRVFAFHQDGAPVEQKPEDRKSEDFVFEIRPRDLTSGATAVLHWSIKGATKITIEEALEAGINSGALHSLGTFEGSSGTLEVKPKQDTTYVISCEGSTTYTCASLSVRVRVKAHTQH